MRGLLAQMEKGNHWLSQKYLGGQEVPLPLNEHRTGCLAKWRRDVTGLVCPAMGAGTGGWEGDQARTSAPIHSDADRAAWQLFSCGDGRDDWQWC